MLTVQEYGRIRIAHRDGMSIRQIARRYGHSRRKIRQVLQESEPRPYTLRQARPAPRLGPYKALIDQILADDEQAPRKQRHTAARLYRRLRDEQGYLGGYDQVRRYVARQRRDRRETFIPLTHPPTRPAVLQLVRTLSAWHRHCRYRPQRLRPALIAVDLEDCSASELTASGNMPFESGTPVS